MTLSDRKQSLLFLVLATAAAAREPDLSDYLAGFPIPESAAIIVDATAVSTGVQAGAVIAPSENVVEDNVSRGAAMARALLNRLGDRSSFLLSLVVALPMTFRSPLLHQPCKVV